MNLADRSSHVGVNEPGDPTVIVLLRSARNGHGNKHTSFTSLAPTPSIGETPALAA
jgi:hypothetical protein